jgi:dihydrofolate reductase
MIISIIAAVAENYVIGKDNKIPWYLPADFKYFKEKTTGHCIIMGRKTYESIGKPLPNRTSIVITKQKDYEAPGCFIAYSLEAAIDLCRDTEQSEAFIIGGKQIYDQALKYSNKLYITKVHAEVEGDTYFPEFSQNEFLLTSSVENKADEKNIYNQTYLTYEKS